MIDLHKMNDLAGLADLARSGQYVTLSERTAVFILEVLRENTVLREQVEELGNVGRGLAMAERLFACGTEVLRSVVVAEGDSVDHLVTQGELLVDAVEHERKALLS